jgi:hypothetical protein
MYCRDHQKQRRSRLNKSKRGTALWSRSSFTIDVVDLKSSLKQNPNTLAKKTHFAFWESALKIVNFTISFI